MSFFSRLIRKAPMPATVTPASTPKADAPPSPAQPSEDGNALPSGERLLELAFDASSAEQRSAQKRLAELIDARVIDVDALPDDAPRLATALAITAATSDPSHFERVATRITDPALWVGLASSGATAKLRQLAAARVESPEALRAVMKAARERDKNVYRIAKAKLDALNAEARRVEAAKAHMHSLADTIERHSYKPFDGAYVATIDHLEREWRRLDVEIPEDVRIRVDAAIDRAREVIAEQIRAAGVLAAHEAAVANAEPVREATLDELRKMLSALYSAQTLDPSAAAGIHERIAKLIERWNDTLQYKAASADESRALEDLSESVRRLTRAYGEGGTLMQQLAAARQAPSDAAMSRVRQLIEDRQRLAGNLPAIVVEAEAATARWAEEQATRRAAIEDTERQVGQLVRKAQHALAAGRSRQAFGIRRSIDAKLAKLPDCPKPLVERLQQLDARLQELQDWRSFAVTPKRGELIAQMQALIGADEHPVRLAERIKRLQEEWRTLAKGGASPEEDWTRFHEAAQAAYAPCKAYFEEQSRLRERNLERRKALVARLDDYERTTDWENADWRHVVNTLRAAQQEWRTSGPTDRAATKPIEQQFDAVIARIQMRLDAEYAANLERKQSLVKQAERLGAMQDLSQAANEVKRLQSAWRSVGVTPQAAGQRLWDEFKRHCDAVFDKRRKAHTDRMAELEQNEEQALALCIELEGLGQRSGTELLAGAQRVRELRESFAHVGELPRDKAREIQGRFRRAVEEFEHAISRERDREANEGWNNVFDAANRIRLHQLEPTTDGESALRQHIASIAQWPKGGKQAIERKLAGPFETDTEANAAALRQIAIRAEIATGAPTPEADQAQRRTLQLQALVKGVGRSTASVREQMEALAFEWIAAGPVASDVYEQLFARFERAWKMAR